MELSSKVPTAIASFPISYENKVLSLGSCFALNVHEKLRYYQFQSICNPWGILFTPSSLAKFLNVVCSKDSPDPLHFVRREGHWVSLDAHSICSSERVDLLENLLLIKAEAFREHLMQATHLIITLGTAWAYRYRTTNQLIANCHKLAQKEFKKEILSMEEVELSLGTILNLVLDINPGLQLIFTISPVRHLKDGFVENQRSKAHLIGALHQFLEENPGVHYFPAYEIMMDELRDYRFYSRDLVHPNEIALELIWQYFQKTWIAPHSMEILEKVEHIQQGLGHRPFDSESGSYKKFLIEIDQKKKELQKRFPFMWRE